METTATRTATAESQPAPNSQNFDTIVIGGGQAGLATGYYLVKAGKSFVILDSHPHVGDAWRNRWDSLTLFTPAKYTQLPGMAFPAPGGSYPTKDQMADYLEAYASTTNMPIRTGVTVNRVDRDADGAWTIETSCGGFVSNAVVIATGGYQIPNIPDWASDFHSDINVLHSQEYRNESQLKQGSVLIVGASHSGADIAVEVAGAHHTLLVGRDVGQMPVKPNGRLEPVIVPLVWFMVNHVVTIDTPVGRRARGNFRAHGFPLEHPDARDIERASVERITLRATGAKDGFPMLADGTVIETQNVIFCTGFRGDYSWIEGVTCDEDHFPVEDRGVVPDAPGLYFVGLKFQQTGASSLVGGVGRDAKSVVDHLCRQSA